MSTQKMPCTGLNCGCTDGVSHSLECHAQHAAAIAGGVFTVQSEHEKQKQDLNAWKDAALALGQRVNFAMNNLTCQGSGVIGNLDKPSSEWQHWRYYFADAMEKIPGVKIDREMLETLFYPRAKRKKLQEQILAKRKACVGETS